MLAALGSRGSDFRAYSDLIPGCWGFGWARGFGIRGNKQRGRGSECSSSSCYHCFICYRRSSQALGWRFCEFKRWFTPKPCGYTWVGLPLVCEGQGSVFWCVGLVAWVQGSGLWKRLFMHFAAFLPGFFLIRANGSIPKRSQLAYISPARAPEP